MFWHAGPGLDDPGDDLAAAALKALSGEGTAELAGVLVNGQPAWRRASLFAAALGALGLRSPSGPLPVGAGAECAGRVMPPAPAGALRFPALPPVDGCRLALDVLAQAPDASVTVLVTTAMTDLDWLLCHHPGLARRKLRAVVAMSGARRLPATSGTAWEPGDEASATADMAAARRVFDCMQSIPWRHVPMTVVCRGAATAAGQVTPGILGWNRASSGSHLAGRDPERAADGPVLDLAGGVPAGSAVAVVAAVEPYWFQPEADPRAPSFSVIGAVRGNPGVRDPAGLNARLAGLLRDGFTGSRSRRAPAAVPALAGAPCGA